MVGIMTITLLVVASVVVGPKELPKASRILGRLTGRTVKFVGEMRQTLNQSKDNEVMQLKTELQQMMGQFSQIQTEVKRGLTMRDNRARHAYSDRSATNTSTASSATASSSAAASTTGGAATPTTVSSVSTVASASALSQNLSKQGAPSQPSFASAFQATVQPLQRANNNNNNNEMATTVERSQVMSQLQEMQAINAEKGNNPYEWDEKEEKWAQEQFRAHREKPVENPFAGVSLGHQPLKDLYEESSTGIRTETMGSGADILSKSILERHFAQFHADMEQPSASSTHGQQDATTTTSNRRQPESQQPIDDDVDARDANKKIE